MTDRTQRKLSIIQLLRNRKLTKGRFANSNAGSQAQLFCAVRHDNFNKAAIGNNEAPEKITLDGSRASHQAVAELKAEGVLPVQTLVRTNRYLNNMIEQDHRKAPQRYYPMLGFKIFGNAEVTLSGIELANKIKKDSSIHRRSPAQGP